jgi:hypothetical protein
LRDIAVFGGTAHPALAGEIVSRGSWESVVVSVTWTASSSTGPRW